MTGRRGEAVPGRAGPSGSGRVALAGGALLTIGVVLVAADLRPAVTSVATLLDQVRAALGASSAWASVLTTLPPLCFAAAGLAAPWVRRRIGMLAGVGAAMLVLAAGLGIRVASGQAVMLIGTVLACVGIAIGNVLIPVLVKESFPARVGLLTGIYTAALQGGSALASAVTPTLDRLLDGWRPALGIWAGLAVLAMATWLAAARLTPLRRPQDDDAADPPGAAPASRAVNLLRNPLAWQVTALFGLQSFIAYVVMGWLPQVFITAGIARQTAGLLLGIATVAAVPASLTIPPLAARHRQQSGWIAGMVICAIAGVLGLLLAPAALPVLWAILTGVGLGVFSMVITVFSLRTRTAGDTARLSTMAQAIGYLVASLGPLLFGLLHGLTGSWSLPLIMVLAVSGLEIIAGWLAGRDRFV
jgi:CP family cyanate transporter-like MFS transporter